MQLLERDGALATLAEARAAAAHGGGRVVYVTGEPGIGKTSLVNRFVEELGADSRVLVGTCDDLSTPRPLGPMQDLVGSVSEPLGEALASSAAPSEIHGLLLAELGLPPQPTVLVLEDVHWADDATLDSIAVVGRRIGSMPALLVLTYRSGEVPPSHPLHAAVDAIGAGDSVFLELAPLSEGAVGALAGDDADRVYAATGGNPFYVAELLASRPAGGLPLSVASAVLGRASRLDEPARRLVELVSVVPNRVATSVLDAVMPDWSAAAEEPERRQLLDVDPRYVRFRHELARHAILSSVPIAARRRLHAEILEALLVGNADPADIVHHAEAAGAEDVVADYALVAARRAAALESNREAFAHYRRAASLVERLPEAEQAKALEELATAAYLVGRLEDAFPAIDQAISLYAEAGEEAAVGRCTRILSRLYWFAGEGALARAMARDAVAILEPLGESVELARAYSGSAQLAALAQDIEQARLWGNLALELAGRLRDENTRAHALVNLGTAELQLDGDGSLLLDAHEVAETAGNSEDAVRALGNLAYTLMCWVKPEPALRYAQQALDYAQEHEVHNFASYSATTIAWLRLRAGEWDEAERITRAELGKGISVAQLLARTVLTELAVRRGDPDAFRRLAELAAHADRTGDLLRITPVLELATERALTSGAPMPTQRILKAVETVRPFRLAPWGSLRVAACAALAGIDVDLERLPQVEGPHTAMARRDWRGAADAFGDVGWMYDRALMLSLLDDEESLVEAIDIARELGAAPLTRRVTRRLRERGLSVPRGPRVSTRANPAGLTARQLEVLSLLVAGLSNAEIADRLVVSPRTAEHHVAAVLTKLGAATRHDAVLRASELGLETRS